MPKNPEQRKNHVKKAGKPKRKKRERQIKISELDAVAGPIFGDRRVLVHIGAHKTATTFLQAALKTNNAKLLEQGVYYIPVNQTRFKGLSNALRKISNSARKAAKLPSLRATIRAAYDQETLARCHTVLISEENLSGSSFKFFHGLGYKNLGERLKFLRDELGANLHVFFSIRAYPDFMASMYSELVRSREYVPWEDFFAKMHGTSPHLFVDAYRSLTKRFGPENVTFWDFRETLAHPQETLSMLAGAPMEFEIDPTPIRASLSGRAIEFLRDFHNSKKGDAIPQRIVFKFAHRMYPASKENGKFDPYTAQERETLNAQYLSDVESIVLKKLSQPT